MNDMTERPILMSAPMVRAILAGTKTQTRRVVKQATGPSLSVDCSDDGVAELSWLWGDGPGYDVHETIKRVSCPYGQPGDRLWVREAWQSELRWDWTAPRDIPPGSPIYFDFYDESVPACAGKKRPSIHMPRWASRITLEVTGVRVERLQDISRADAIAEGVRPLVDSDGPNYWTVDTGFGSLNAPTAQHCYELLWNWINGPESWDANPWVWVIEFKRIKP